MNAPGAHSSKYDICSFNESISYIQGIDYDALYLNFEQIHVFS